MALVNLSLRKNWIFEPNQTLLYAKFDNIKKSQFVVHQLQIPLSVYVQSNKIKVWVELVPVLELWCQLY